MVFSDSSTPWFTRGSMTQAFTSYCIFPQRPSDSTTRLSSSTVACYNSQGSSCYQRWPSYSTHQPHPHSTNYVSYDAPSSSVSARSWSHECHHRRCRGCRRPFLTYYSSVSYSFISTSSISTNLCPSATPACHQKSRSHTFPDSWRSTISASVFP